MTESKKNQNKGNYNKTKELKNSKQNHSNTNDVNKKAEQIIGDSILHGIDQRDLLNETFKIITKHHPGSRIEDITQPNKARNSKAT